MSSLGPRARAEQRAAQVTRPRWHSPPARWQAAPHRAPCGVLEAQPGAPGSRATHRQERVPGVLQDAVLRERVRHLVLEDRPGERGPGPRPAPAPALALAPAPAPTWHPPWPR